MNPHPHHLGASSEGAVPQSPIPQQPPSWGPPTRGVFVNVLGTIVAPLENGNFPEIGDAVFYEGVLDGLFKVTQSGWNLYLMGNIDSVAFGRQGVEEWRSFSKGLHDHLRGHGIKLKRDYCCIDHPEGVKGQNNDSVYLLPGTGAMHHAAQADGVNLSVSWVIGDSTVELVAGWRADCRLVAVQTGQGLRDGAFQVEPELWSRTAAGALKEISNDLTMLRRVA
ncbi:D-glycero-alpha-D-manno-heptose-1,7-bisphosphate 7-phosphatase [Planctomycetes bacterium Poly30]|uniref:D-glycero-alpha-D-manno-heptose-1,7-bisphosphate 7-phosphatase n=1 Tax=Saltatorellus ferox TaxID=2528018 RepID=A0A518EU84_9BACT|nr:D-glycero-alpha-D-manno-heptose-1,7-bisphosphate 7-phosphatase [Planctomycetes bacterium Poly30]